MTIKGISKSDFKQLLGKYLSSSQPVSNHEHLMGRTDMLQKIERAFTSAGRHIFIHGDRGIGKTSLARAAATFHQDSSLPLRTVQCERGATGYGIMRDIALKILPPMKKGAVFKRVTKQQFRISLPGLSYEKANELSEGTIPEIASVNEALTIVESLARTYNNPPVVIIDEFDQIDSMESRRSVASFIKGVTDQEIPLRFIICGIGDSLDAMIGEHQSTGRLLAPLRLEAITVDARLDIMRSVAGHLGVEVDYESLMRAALISDGFPYYVHLIGEHLFWQMFDDPRDVTVSSPEHFDRALTIAAEMAEPNLKSTYEKATQKYKNDYEEVLWAVADNSMMRRQLSEIYTSSYLRIMELRKKAPLAKATFSSKLSALASDRHGSILEGTGAGWYQFRENRHRGYVRLVAERNGISLHSEHHLRGALGTSFEDVA
ncbi:MAG: AAA family ATPase [Hyphomicrobium sp.]|uniref:AAA family ATPase n=1 Tax=Hyphomicrobium sp. TaxID=82 RepID=UPI003D0FAE49